MWKLGCDSVKKVVCAFRSHADPGLQAKLVQKMVPKSMLFLALVFVKILVRFGVRFGGTILVKNREKCVAKTSLREVVKMVRNKR